MAQMLTQQEFIVLDGGLATELEAQGADLNHPLWSARVLVEAPHLIEEVNLEYLKAGADVVSTASYQATILGLMAASGVTAPQAEAILRRSVAIAQQARDRFWSDSQNRKNRLKPLVAASIGPYGAYLHDGSEYLGHYGLSRMDLKDFHRARLAILLECSPDVIAFESFPSQVEAEAVLELLAEFPKATGWISFTCRNESAISEGTPFADAVALAASSPQIEAIGVNCVAPRLVEPLLKIAASVTDKPLAAYPNSGETFDPATCKWAQASELSTLENSVLDWYRAGARLIGGCCRTTPETIRFVRSALSRMHQLA